MVGISLFRLAHTQFFINWIRFYLREVHDIKLFEGVSLLLWKTGRFGI